MLNENFAILGGLITLLGGSKYIIETVKGRIQPNRVSWFFWAVAPLIAFAAQVSQGVGLQAILTFSVGFIPAMVFIASFINKKAYWKLETFDLICGSLSLIGIILWYTTKIGNVAILFSIFADFTASLPTALKAYKEPESESYSVFFANTISAIITMLTIRNWNFETAAFPIYILLMMGLIFILIKYKLGKVWKIR
ncbi:MAG: hypothetical protein UX31_C0012G0013 [Candidatus Nomurabacteria bacterium GW2011_GWA1_46_11]|uniref:Uncharacterized protein n=1 Tax=Candidatus Nomurabacteria bacterium GW2011_GWA1_46_11 TaxID=1618732 RepID=A0A0G1NN58_9BACT|nr:MAG: hypothetical protein UW69_C0029G0010 [Microgenomates group bacterium GW2011_GWA2_44_7]KKT77952.1 MAG: hypothetical protein UW73_C0009G0051 [Microgenomates group bacterium GW2011_GWB1_44_8]KKU21777.1 MAG: hypothetical protein UX31_C0012G0013 [Candidatus Nomurabacteria bacterium GW2011_GWA1_46_11]